VSREHRRAKTDRIDAALLMRSFLGWLRGEARHCQMVAVPTNGGRGRPAAEPGARDPGGGADASGEPDEGALIRFGIRNFKPTLRKAQERVADLRTAEETPLPAETLAELRRDMARVAPGARADQGDRDRPPARLEQAARREARTHGARRASPRLAMRPPPSQTRTRSWRRIRVWRVPSLGHALGG